MPKKRPPAHKCERSNCKGWAKVGHRFCWRHIHHEDQVGVNAARFTHGRYSASLPENLKGKYSEAKKDKRLLELEDEIAVCIARSQQLQEKLSTFESGRAWREIKKAIGDLEKAIASLDGKAVNEGLSELNRLSNEGCGEYALWREQQEIFTLHQKLVESQRKRQLELKQYLSIERLLVIIDAITHAVTSEVEEASKRKAIVEKLNALLTTEHTHTAELRERAQRLEANYQREIEDSGLF